MELWSGTLREFVRDGSSGVLPGDMLRGFYNYHRYNPSKSETDSWAASLAVVAETLRPIEKSQIGVVLEYHMPYSMNRVDLILIGENGDSVPTALIVELKQWSAMSSAGDFSENVMVGGTEHVHPCQQAKDYADTLSNVHSSFTDGDYKPRACAFCHNLDKQSYPIADDSRFSDLLNAVPLFGLNEHTDFRDFVSAELRNGNADRLIDDFTLGKFKPSKKLLEHIAETIEHGEEWNLLDTQRLAYNRILSEVRERQKKKGSSAILVSGGPGTGKSVIAVQLLATVLRLGYSAAHSTGGKAFNTVLKSKFSRAKDLFIYNLNLRKAPTHGLDLLCVDEAHRIRKNSDTRFTPASERDQRSQMEELLNAAKVSVFFLDENQYMRPDEVGCADLVSEWAGKLNIPLTSFELTTQFRCGASTEYIKRIDRLLGFSDDDAEIAESTYDFHIVQTPDELEEKVKAANSAGLTARMVAGFCWAWSNPLADDTLVPDVTIGDWARPWNAKADSKKTYKPGKHPYTLWAETEAGVDQIGCIYSAQGFEFDHVGVIWGEDLVWRDGNWVAQKEKSFDRPVKTKTADTERLLRNAYRVLLTRGIVSTSIYFVDTETRKHVESNMPTTQDFRLFI